MRLKIATPSGFSFRRTLLSHGWCALAPFRVDPDYNWIEGVAAGEGDPVATYRLAPVQGAVVLDSPGRGDAATRRLLRDTARRVLNLDLDLTPFYSRVRKTPNLAWIAKTGYGRLLRAPTTFEDLVKLVLTTNCSWAFTQQMVRRLVDTCGPVAENGEHGFPDAEAIARAGERTLREEIRTGYRASSLAALARRVTEGEIDPEAWGRHEGDPDDLRRDLLRLPGVGPYVADSLLKLMGRPCGLGLDSFLRAEYARVYHGGRRVTDRTIARRYARLDRWAALALWCDMTRDDEDRG